MDGVALSIGCGFSMDDEEWGANIYEFVKERRIRYLPLQPIYTPLGATTRCGNIVADSCFVLRFSFTAISNKYCPVH